LPAFIIEKCKDKLTIFEGTSKRAKTSYRNIQLEDESNLTFQNGTSHIKIPKIIFQIFLKYLRRENGKSKSA
jgi:hypothetical protein